MNIPTHKKGDIAVGHVVSDLLKRGFNVFFPLSTHACAYDLIATFTDGIDERLVRVQVKYNRLCHNKYSDRVNPFDLYALYCPEYDRILYSRFDVATAKSIKIAHELPNSATPFWWWEDFSDPKVSLRKVQTKRTISEFGKTIKLVVRKGRKSKMSIPAVDLQRLLWKQSLVLIAKELGVSDVGLAKRIRKLQLISPPAGYWASSPARRKKIRSLYKASYNTRIAELSV